jgi:hypothetical protein
VSSSFEPQQVPVKGKDTFIVLKSIVLCINFKFESQSGTHILKAHHAWIHEVGELRFLLRVALDSLAALHFAVLRMRIFIPSFFERLA